jgi:hypothetical protein
MLDVALDTHHPTAGSPTLNLEFQATTLLLAVMGCKVTYLILNVQQDSTGPTVMLGTLHNRKLSQADLLH